MIDNILDREQLSAFARRQALGTIRKTVKKADIEAALGDGWQIRKKNRRSVSLERPKKRAALLESRVWTLLHRMGFSHLSGEGGASLTVTPDDKDSPITQLDVVAIDDEVALCLECKSFEAPKKEPRFAEKLGKLALSRRRFAESTAKAVPQRKKRHVGMAMFTWDMILTDGDRKRADEEHVTVFDEHDLRYFEALVRHLGSAARYQFLSELFPGKQISGLEIRVPALRAKVGDLTCYTFSLRPDYLLKIAYVAHRSKAKAIDIDAYQRMISRARLTQIGKYIDENGVFPTNIVINVENKHHLTFDRGKQEGDDAGALFGWLKIFPCYGAAWIIDGQHRLFAYSGHARAATSFLNVVAFEGLSASKQAQLFVDINSEQRRVGLAPI